MLGNLPNKIIGGALRGAASAYAKLRNAGSHFPDYLNSLRGSRAFQFFSRENSQLLKLNGDNFRKNLIRHSGINPGLEYQAHHVFPQALRERFKKIGINVDDPKYGREIARRFLKPIDK